MNTQKLKIGIDKINRKSYNMHMKRKVKQTSFLKHVLRHDLMQSVFRYAGPKEKRELKATLYKRQKKRSRHPLIKRVALLYLAQVMVIVGSYVGFNIESALLLNRKQPNDSPFTPDNVFDNNGNDFEIGPDGQIDIDTMTEEEKQILLNSANSVLMQNANWYLEDEAKIEKINQIVSVSSFPYNEYAEDNEYDKNFVSILLNANDNQFYALNYLTGDEFSSTTESSKTVLSDFLLFLQDNCAADSCSQMSEQGKQIQELDENTVFVGDAICGYDSNNRECYRVPVYQNDGTVTVYSTTDTNEDPMDLLFEQMSGQTGQTITFTSQPVSQNECFQKLPQIYQNLQEKEAEEQKSDDQPVASVPKQERKFEL